MEEGNSEERKASFWVSDIGPTTALRRLFTLLQTSIHLRYVCATLRDLGSICAYHSWGFRFRVSWPASWILDASFLYAVIALSFLTSRPSWLLALIRVLPQPLHSSVLIMACDFPRVEFSRRESTARKNRILIGGSGNAKLSCQTDSNLVQDQESRTHGDNGTTTCTTPIRFLDQLPTHCPWTN